MNISLISLYSCTHLGDIFPPFTLMAMLAMLAQEGRAVVWQRGQSPIVPGPPCRFWFRQKIRLDLRWSKNVLAVLKNWGFIHLFC